MNIFIEKISKGKITSETDLKKLFWKLAKALHPDVSSVENNKEKFVIMKNDYDKAIKYFKKTGIIENKTSSAPDFTYCKEMFCDLVAGNFPIDPSIRNRNKVYLDRINEFNSKVIHFGKEYADLIIKVEKELYQIRGSTTVSNHIFNLIKLLFYRISDYYYNGNSFSKKYIKNSYIMVIDCLEEKKAYNTIFFINWLIREII